jgi:hypothetical protein
MPFLTRTKSLSCSYLIPRLILPFHDRYPPPPPPYLVSHYLTAIYTHASLHLYVLVVSQMSVSALSGQRRALEDAIFDSD